MDVVSNFSMYLEQHFLQLLSIVFLIIVPIRMDFKYII